MARTTVRQIQMLPTDSALWPLFKRDFVAAGGHPDVVTLASAFEKHGRLVWELYLSGYLAGVQGEAKPKSRTPDEQRAADEFRERLGGGS
jgi:hypothetical protein